MSSALLLAYCVTTFAVSLSLSKEELHQLLTTPTEAKPETFQKESIQKLVKYPLFAMNTYLLSVKHW